ncbi:MAG: ligand-binding sensor domain-containing protein [Bacteroidia bacterium]
MRIKYLFAVCLVCLVQISFGQLLRFEQIDDKLGLSQNTVHSMAQDDEGFLWIGTEDGLNRFDGYNFDVLRFHENDPNSIYPGRIKQLSYHSGSLGVLTESGISIVNTHTKKSKNYVLPLTINEPRFLFLTKDKIWMGADNGLYLLDKASGGFKSILPYAPITGISLLKQGVLLVSTPDEIYLIYLFNNVVRRVNFKSQYLILGSSVNAKGVVCLVTDNHEFVVGSVFKRNFRIKRSITIPEGGVFRTIFGGRYRFFLGFDNGLIVVDSLFRLKHYYHQPDNKFSLSHNKVLSIFQDRNLNLWIGTSSGGLNRYHPYRFKFNSISGSTGSEQGSSLNIYAVSPAPNNTFIISTDEGRIFNFSPETNELEQKAFLKPYPIYCITPINTDSTEFLLGSSKGIFKYNSMSGKADFIQISGMEKYVNQEVLSCLKETDNRFWLAGKEGLFLVDIRQKSIIMNYDISNSGLGGNNVRNLIPDKNGNFFIATSKGLYYYTKDNSEISSILVARNGRKLHVTSALKSKNGELFIGTINQGLYLKKSNGNVQNFTTDNGLANNNVYSVQKGNLGDEIWLSTNSGVSKMNLKDFTFKNYDLNDGLQGNEFNEKTSANLSDGRILFGGVNGFSYFYPSDINDDTTNCQVAIKSFSSFNKIYDTKQDIFLSYDQNYINIEYVALDFNLSGNNRFMYQVDGLNEEWTDAGNRRFASFAQLAPGSYTFRVKASNSDGVFSSNVAQLSFYIAKPFWTRWWFRITTILFLAGIITIIIYWRVRNVINEEQEKLKISGMVGELELKALRAQMNPHFIFNSLNSIQDFVLNHQGMEAAKYLSKFARLVRMILDNSEYTFISISQKIEFLRLYIELESLRMDNGFEFHLSLDKSVNLEDQIPTMVIQPYVENAIWHGLQYKKSHRVLKLHLSMEDEDFVRCEIEDNGIGREAAMQIKKQKGKTHDSKAMRITDERIQILKKLYGFGPSVEVIDLVDDGIARGTMVILKLPIHHG